MSVKLMMAGALALGLLPSIAIANPFADDTAKVSLAGLDLHTQEGQARLASRIANAASAVCGRSLDHIHLEAVRKAAECRAEVTAELNEQLASRGYSPQLASAQ
jgi:UrcA family protein